MALPAAPAGHPEEAAGLPRCEQLWDTLLVLLGPRGAALRKSAEGLGERQLLAACAGGAAARGTGGSFSYWLRNPLGFAGWAELFYCLFGLGCRSPADLSLCVLPSV